MAMVVGLIGTGAMLVGLVLIPIGLPGLWLIASVVLGLTLWGALSWGFAVAVIGLAAAAELAEFLVLRSFGRRFGGSRKAFWAAVFGGLAGLFVGVPIPVIGPLVTAFVGTFLGAGVVTYHETRSVTRSTRVGWGLVLARTAAVGLKVATAVCVVAASSVMMIL